MKTDGWYPSISQISDLNHLLWPRSIAWCLGALVPCRSLIPWGSKLAHPRPWALRKSHLPRIPDEAQDTGHCLGSEAAEARRGHHALILIPGPDHGKQEKTHGYGSRPISLIFFVGINIHLWNLWAILNFTRSLHQVTMGWDFDTSPGCQHPQRPKIVPHLEDSIKLLSVYRVRWFFPAITSI